MDDLLAISLVVTGIGMLMLFLALAFLYGLMVLMTRMTYIRALIRKRPEAEGKEQEAGSKKREAGSRKRRAAAIAVALARAEGELSTVGPSGAEEAISSWHVSRWRALHHQRQLTLSLRARRGR